MEMSTRRARTYHIIGVLGLFNDFSMFVFTNSVERSRVCKCWVGPEWALERSCLDKGAYTAILGSIFGAQILPGGSGCQSFSISMKKHVSVLGMNDAVGPLGLIMRNYGGTCAIREKASRELPILSNRNRKSLVAKPILFSFPVHENSVVVGIFFEKQKDANYLKSDEKRKIAQTSFLARFLTHPMLTLCLIFIALYELHSINQRRERRSC